VEYEYDIKSVHSEPNCVYDEKSLVETLVNQLKSDRNQEIQNIS